MRTAGQRLKEMFDYNTLEGQDLIETLLHTGMAAGGQALFTDMTPEQIALASAAGFGAGMVGRKVGAPIGQRIGQTIGNNVQGANDVAAQALAAARQVAANIPGSAGRVLDMKLNPVSHLDAAAQYGNMIGRNRGDDLAQLAVALAAPGIFGGEKDAE